MLLSPIAILSSPEVKLPRAVVPTLMLFALFAVKVLEVSSIDISAIAGENRDTLHKKPKQI